MPQRKRGHTQRLTLWTGGAVLLLAVVIAGVLLNRSPQEPVVAVTPGDFQLERQPVLGDPQAPVIVVEFGDYKCPACKAFHEQVYPRLVLDYVDMNLVAFSFLNFQFLGPDSITAGIGGECVYHLNPPAFWDYYDTVYTHQGPESQRWATPDRLEELVRQDVPDVDPQAFRACLDERRYADEVELDKRIGSATGVNATPTIFVNGRKLSNWSYAGLRAAIERELAEQP